MRSSRGGHTQTNRELSGLLYVPVSGRTSLRLRVADSKAFLQGWWLVNRPDLHTAMKEKAASTEGPGVPVRIHTGIGVESVDCEAATILLSDGTRVGGDLVVCADGIHSKTRASVAGRQVPMISTGHACYRWLTPASRLADNPVTKTFLDKPGHFVQITGSDRRIVLYPCSGGQLVNCVAFAPREEVGEIKKGEKTPRHYCSPWSQYC